MLPTRGWRGALLLAGPAELDRALAHRGLDRGQREERGGDEDDEHSDGDGPRPATASPADPAVRDLADRDLADRDPAERDLAVRDLAVRELTVSEQEGDDGARRNVRRARLA